MRDVLVRHPGHIFLKQHLMTLPQAQPLANLVYDAHATYAVTRLPEDGAATRDGFRRMGPGAAAGILVSCPVQI